MKKHYIWKNFTLLLVLWMALPGNLLGQQVWEKIDNHYNHRLLIGTTVLDQNIFLFGGTDPVSFQHLPTVEKLNTVSGEMSLLSSLSVGLPGANAAAVGQLIYVTGGFVDPNTATDQLQIFDPESDSWSAGKESPVSLGHHVSGVIDGKLYLTGGLQQDGDPKKDVPSGTWVYDPVTDLWDSLAPMHATLEVYNRGRWQASSNVYDGKLYVFGGMKKTNGSGECEHSPMAIPEVYDPKTDTWTKLARMPVPLAHHVSIIHNDTIYLFGGTIAADYWTGSSVYNYRILAYEPLQDKWHYMSDTLPFTNSGNWGEKVGNSVYMALGDEEMAIYKFDLESLNPVHVNRSNPEMDITFYPNPVQDVLQVKTGIPGTCEIRISSLCGKLLHQETLTDPAAMIHFSTYPEGIYLITLSTTDFTVTRKVLKH